MSSASGRSSMHFIIALVVLRITLINAFSVAAEVMLVVSSGVWMGGVHSEGFSWGSTDPIELFGLWRGVMVLPLLWVSGASRSVLREAS